MTDNSAAFGNVAPMDENMDWNEELGQGTDGLEYDYTGALVEEARGDDLEVQAMHSYLEYLFLQKEGMFTELYNKDDTYIKRNRKYIRKILLLINPKWVDPDETSHMFKYIPRGEPLPMNSPDEIEAANKDAVARFQETNASFSNFVIDRADTIRARMAAMPDEFPALSATTTSSPAAAAAGS